MYSYHGELLHLGEEQDRGVEAGKVASVIDSLAEVIITSSLELH